MKLLLLLVAIAALNAACGDLPTSPSREKVQPVPMVDQTPIVAPTAR